VAALVAGHTCSDFVCQTLTSLLLVLHYFVCSGSAASSPVSSSSGGSGGAQVVADGPLTCFAMKRSDFERLLGPYEELWRYEALRKVSDALRMDFGSFASLSCLCFGC
jgi:hypothetical protein